MLSNGERPQSVVRKCYLADACVAETRSHSSTVKFVAFSSTRRSHGHSVSSSVDAGLLTSALSSSRSKMQQKESHCAEPPSKRNGLV